MIFLIRMVRYNEGVVECSAGGGGSGVCCWFEVMALTRGLAKTQLRVRSIMRCR